MTATRMDGSTCIVTRPHTPVAPGHLVVCLSTDAAPAERGDEVLLVRAYRAAQEMARRELGHPGCFTLLFSGSRTRLRPESHVHVFLLRSVRAKRWLFVRMLAKPVLRWLRLLEVRG